MTLKFANIAKNGDKIRAHDFKFAEKPCYYEGTVVEADFHAQGEFKAFMVKVEKRVFNGEEIAVQSGTVFVPHETPMDWDGRVELIEEAGK